MEAIAKQKYLKGSPRKARLVIDLIRGRNVSQALAILQFTNKRAAKPIAKCLNSAIANATYLAEQKNIAVDPDDLWVKTCYVDMGPTKNRRRMRPAPQGRAYREQRHYCHITIEVSSEAPVKKGDDKKGKKADSGDKKAQSEPKAKVTKKAPKVEAENVGIDETKKTEAAAEVKETKSSKKETKKDKGAETKAAAGEEKPKTKADDKEQETPFENKPVAAQTDEEKSDSKMADDAKVDKVEDLERQ